MSGFLYKHVLLVGATSGIGSGMADRLVEAGIKVTAVGRRKERLDEFVQKHTQKMTQGLVFDVGDIGKAPQFAADVMKQYPDIDCVFLNAGTQRFYDLTNPKDFDVKSFQHEINVNFMSNVALTQAFLPFMMPKNSSFIFTTSLLSITPLSSIPAYSASKAALNSFILCLREQLKRSTVKVIEVSPPLVQSELPYSSLMRHTLLTIYLLAAELNGPVGMPLKQYVEETWKGLESGSDQVVGGTLGNPKLFMSIVHNRRKIFEEYSNSWN
ncbi:Glucose/ribitol dehydrogenase [Penicillium nucicola]|uniref:Glucose/ribitol dehydrogenase n=1 Tax=Penicillium nucicola TaxID=1850975 RepID=UPI0025457551|nr:Glucose/ribitol dehydrogenase [Penicillium nucicola]XP_056978585.1 Glucose/ribitol dehydrogenase [Penicillium nucicola]KAJ5742473.1 Glucose/ribitol dehydrogenase [Penicillium nucicola]KAJ5742519.1 Glucose/ribitol dehydrogenase [Penicillium nucicola]